MENIIAIKDKIPKIDSHAYINPYAIVIGDVNIEAGASLWPGVIVQGNDGPVLIGGNSAILDNSIIKSVDGKTVSIGADVLISHGAILHGCSVGSKVLIGKSVNILECSEVGEGSVIDSGAIITANSIIPARSKVTGTPGKVTGSVTDSELDTVQAKRNQILKKARKYGEWFVAKNV
jgi:carbonic anhydrase/acetyltransferase-like protein (isoleucine patch superfamily)